MIYLLTILIALFLGYNLGIRHEQKKYIRIEDSESEEDDIIIKEEKIPLSHRIFRSVRRNLF